MNKSVLGTIAGIVLVGLTKKNFGSATKLTLRDGYLYTITSQVHITLSVEEYYEIQYENPDLKYNLIDHLKQYLSDTDQIRLAVDTYTDEDWEGNEINVEYMTITLIREISSLDKIHHTLTEQVSVEELLLELVGHTEVFTGFDTDEMNEEITDVVVSDKKILCQFKDNKWVGYKPTKKEASKLRKR